LAKSSHFVGGLALGNYFNIQNEGRYWFLAGEERC
jgi:hypothetical protein